MPAQVTGRIGRLSSSRYRGSPQVARAQVATVVIFCKRHVKNMRHANRAGEKTAPAGRGRYCRTWVASRRGATSGLQQPLLHPAEAAEYLEHRGQHQHQQRDQFDQRLEGDGGDQSGIALL